jgi:hypothetical protein
MEKKNEKWVLITGASTGIGRAAAEYLSQHGFNIYAGARKTIDLDNLGKIPNVVSVSLDVTNEQDLKEVFKFISNRNTGLFGLINNAGIALAGPAMELDIEVYRQQFEVNLFGVHSVTKTFFPLIQESQGKIIMIGSGAGLIANPFFSPYSSSKFALEGYTDALRRELMVVGIQVIMIEPGMVKTPIWDKGEIILNRYSGNLLKDEVECFGTLAITTARDIGLDPIKLAVKIHKVLTHRNPKPRYLVAPDYLQTMIMKKMPTRLLDKLIRKVMQKK